jgi:DNA-binding helix-hairpin-helix protein with protein kinase domain
MPAYMPPELIGKKLKETPRTVEQEVFSVSLIMFRLFMFGQSPYSCIGGDNPVSNLKSGKSPIGYNSKYKFSKGPWKNFWLQLPEYLKELFIKMFIDGHYNAELRPRLIDFKLAFERYLTDLNNGSLCADLFPKIKK